MAEDGGDPVAAHAFNIHEVGVGALHQPLLLVSSLLISKAGVHQVLSQRHFAQTTEVFPSKAKNNVVSKLSK